MRYLIVVDMQNDFVTGSLGSKMAEMIVPAVCEKIRRYKAQEEHIIEKYNKIFRIQMPKVTPHVCRHTFCSNMAKSGMNPKTLQYIMGHSDISVTLNVYTHVQFDDAQAELLRVAKA